METRVVQPERDTFGDSPRLSFPLATEGTAKSAGQPHPPLSLLSEAKLTCPSCVLDSSLNLDTGSFAADVDLGTGLVGVSEHTWLQALSSWKASRSRSANCSHPQLLHFHLSHPASPCSFCLRDLSALVCSLITSKLEIWNPIRLFWRGIHFKVNSCWLSPCLGLLLQVQVLHWTFCRWDLYKGTLLWGRQRSGCHSGDGFF